MTESYISSRASELSPSLNGLANGSTPPHAHNSGLSNVIRKKLMGYVGFANLPNQVHRKSVRKGFQFTAMVVGALGHRPIFVFHPFDDQFLGESGLGKSTLINTLFNTTLYPPKVPLPPSSERAKTVAIESIGAGVFLPMFSQRGDSVFFNIENADIEENGVRLRLTVVDTPGFGDFVNNDDRYAFFFSLPFYRLSGFFLILSSAGNRLWRTSSPDSIRISSRKIG
jgi:septin 7